MAGYDQSREGLQVAPNQDNYPEVHETTKGQYQLSTVPANSPPPATTFGLSRRAFIITSTLAIAIVLAGALGGGLGGGLSAKNQCHDSAEAAVTATATHVVTSCPTASSATPTGTTDKTCSKSSSDCPDSDGKTYNSTMFLSNDNGPVPDGAKNGLRFVKSCSSYWMGDNLVQTQIASFDACIDMCASYNFWSNSTDCKGCSYSPEGTCWAHSSLQSTAEGSGFARAVLLSDS